MQQEHASGSRCDAGHAKHTMKYNASLTMFSPLLKLLMLQRESSPRFLIPSKSHNSVQQRWIKNLLALLETLITLSQGKLTPCCEAEMKQLSSEILPP